MFSINTDNLQIISANSPQNSLSDSEINQHQHTFDHYLDLVSSRGQGWADLPFDNQVVQNIVEFSQQARGKYSTIVVLGIGGSMLGPKCILDVLDANHRQGYPEVICLDNIDPYITNNIANSIDFSQTLFLVQTKSGSTPETASQYLYFSSLITAKGLNLADHLVIVTDPDAGVMRNIAETQGIKSFPLPSNVGGRYSVLSAMGLVVASLVGLDIQKLLDGAKNIVENEIKLAFTFASIQFQLLQKGKNINVIMPYSSRLKSFSEWTVQLISESLGKKFDTSGKLINTGITPLVSVGATDQHSQLQLFAEGQKDKLMIFLEVVNQGKEVVITESSSVAIPQFEYLSGVSFNQLLSAELFGTKQSLTEELVPNVTITIDTIDEFSLGQLFMFFQFATAFVGEMLHIDTFDQPGVERSKVLTKQKLAKN